MDVKGYRTKKIVVYESITEKCNLSGMHNPQPGTLW